MGDILKHIFDFIFFRTKKNTLKIFYTICILLTILFINDYFGISKNILIDRKLSQLQKLKEIAPEKFHDSLIQVELINIQNGILDKSTFVERARFFIREQFTGILTWRNLSACILFLIGMLMGPYLAFKGNPQKSFVKNVTILVLVEIVFFTICFILVKILSLIPQFKYGWINYLINYLFQVLLVIPFSLKKSKK